MGQVLRILAAGCVVAAICTVLAACSSSDSPPTAHPAPPGSTIPFPDDRRASTDTPYTLTGKDAEQRSPGAQEFGTALMLDAAGTAAEFAVYRFNPPSEAYRVEVQLNPAGTTAAFVGLADFSTLRWEFSGPYAATATVELDSAMHLSPAGNVYIAVLAARKERAQIDGLTLFAQNLWPHAELVAAQRPDTSPLVIDFDASGSFDPDGTIVAYHWDFEDDGTRDLTTTTPLASHVYTATGTYSAWVVAEDNGGKSSPAGALVNYYAPAVLGDAFGYTSLALINGTPAIAFADAFSGGDLRYIQAADPEGLAWGPSQVIDPGGWAATGEGVSLAVVSGSPALTYYDQTSKELRYLRATDANGTAWGSPTVIDNDVGLSGSGRRSSLMVVDGNPAVGYFAGSPHLDLRYSRALDDTGSTWAAPQILESNGDVGRYPSMAVVAGNPAIAYQDSSNNYLRYLRADDAAGASWGSPSTLDNVYTGYDPSLIVVKGNPALCYCYVEPGVVSELRYMRATDAVGSTWGPPLVLDSGSGVGMPALAVVSGSPVVSYGKTGDLRLILASDPDGAIWGSPRTLDSTGTVGGYSSLIDCQGQPAVSYIDSSGGKLRYLTGF